MIKKSEIKKLELEDLDNPSQIEYQLALLVNKIVEITNKLNTRNVNVASKTEK